MLQELRNGRDWLIEIALAGLCAKTLSLVGVDINFAFVGMLIVIWIAQRSSKP